MKTKLTKKVLGCVGVDSGQLLIADPCYLTGDEAKQFDYDALCKLDLSRGNGQVNYVLGHAGAGVKLDSFGGDGCFDVVGYFSEGLLKKIVIEF